MTIRVILADDHQIVREGLQLVLRHRADIDVIAEAGDGREVIDLATRLEPDVVVMDIAMADLGGIEATRQLMRDRPRMKVVALSAYADRRYVLGMLEAGASGYVLKANAGEELVGAIHAAMQGRTYLTPEVADMIGDAHVTRDLRRADPADAVLSPREREVLQLLAEGKSSKEIAAQLFISTRTAETHRRNIVKKLNLHSVAELTKYAIREGLTPLDS